MNFPESEGKQRPNKSAIKREIALIVEFIFKLAKLTPKQLAQLNLPEEVYRELLNAVALKHAGARARHLKYVAGILRADEGCQEIIAAVLAKTPQLRK